MNPNNNPYANFTFDFDESSDDLPMPSYENDEVSSLALDSKEKYSVLIARHYKNREDYEKFLSVFEYLTTEKLIGSANRALKDVGQSWFEAEAYTGLPDDTLERMLIDGTGFDPMSFMRSAQRSLWSTGLPTMKIGEDLSDRTPYSHLRELSETLSDLSAVASGAETFKLHSSSNLFRSIITCAPNEVRKKITNRLSQLKETKEIVSQFVQGKLPYKLDLKSFKASKEPGLALPHTLSPQDWIGSSVTALMEMEFGSKLMVAFKENDCNQLRQYHGADSDYLLFSDDEESAYSISNTPAIYSCDQFDESGEWIWRSIEERVKKRVSYEVVQGGLKGQQQSHRDELSKRFELEEALSLKGESDEIAFSGVACIAKVPRSLSKRLGKTMCIQFWKRGYSKKTEIDENDTYVHICKNSVVSSLEAGKYYPIMLPDFQSVVLMPPHLWSLSRFMSNKDRDTPSAYRSRLGIRSLSADMSYIQLYFTLFQLAHTFKMFECWNSGKPYDGAAYSEEILPLLQTSVDANFCSLFKGKVSKPQNRRIVLGAFSGTSIGSITGLWIAPATSKLGKAGLVDIKADNAFMSIADDLNNQGLYNPNDQFNADLGGLWFDFADSEDFDSPPRQEVVELRNSDD